MPVEPRADPPAAWASRCLRCESVYPLHDDVAGCPSCSAAGVGVPLVPFRTSGPPPEQRPATAPAGTGGLWRWAAHLLPVSEPVSLGEGGTPLTALGIDGPPGRLLLKDERANPTGSFKDRLASAVVSRASESGADTVVVSSSGNAGLAVAAYAARAGLRCVLLATGDLPAQAVAAASAMGARVCVTDDHDGRWRAARTGVERLGWFPVTNHSRPPVASHPAGLLAYRTIAFEVAEALDWSVPDWVVVPVSRGDGLYGVWSGFVELARLGWTSRVPRMLAVERFPSLSGALRDRLAQPRAAHARYPVRAVSIADPQGTAMALHTVRRSGGDVVCCDDDTIAAAWSRLAAGGTLLELSSAAVLPGVDALAARQAIDDASTTLVLATAGPYAQPTLDPAPPPARLRDPGDAAELSAALESR